MRILRSELSSLSLAAVLLVSAELFVQAQSPSPSQTTPPAAPAAPVPPGSESGLISNFDDGSASVKFGAGWTVSTDSLAGGTSTAEIRVIEGGANKSKGALEITGNVTNVFTYPWAGVMFSPGSAPFTPANLSSKKALHFWARGDSRTFRAMIFTTSGGRIPAMKNFSVTPEWKEFVFPFSEFNGTDGRDIIAILFASSMDPGTFKFAIDEVRLD